MRSRGVVLLASRISVPSPATPCTLITPNGAPHGLISRICFLPFTGANAEACLRMVPRRDLSTLHLVSHTNALYTKSPLGCLHGLVAHIGRMRLSSVHHAPSTHYQPQYTFSSDQSSHQLTSTAQLTRCQQDAFTASNRGHLQTSLQGQNPAHDHGLLQQRSLLRMQATWLPPPWAEVSTGDSHLGRSTV